MPVTAVFAGPVQTDTQDVKRVRFQMRQSQARVHQNQAQNINNGSADALKLQVPDDNTDNMWSNADNTKFVAPVTGSYLLMAGIALTAANPFNLYISVNGGGFSGGAATSSGGPYAVLTDKLPLTAGDTVQFVINPTGGNVTTRGDNTCFGAMLYVGEKQP